MIMSNSKILAAILKIYKIGQQDAISQLANIVFFLIQQTTPDQSILSKSFLHKMHVLDNFSGFFF